MSRLLLRKLAMCAMFGVLAMLLSACEDKPQHQAKPPLVRYIKVEEKKLVMTTELSARVSALMTSEVRPQVTGIVQQRLFEEGADVEAGQVLYQIDPAMFQAAYNIAEAELQKALANEVSARLLAERYAKIIRSNAVSRQEHDNAVSANVQAKAVVEAARQQLETARINLDYTRVTAPVRGRISRSFMTPGSLVTQNQPQAMALIQHIDDVYVDITQSSTAVLRLRRALAGGTVSPTGVESATVRLKFEDGSPYAVPQDAATDAAGPDAAQDAGPDAAAQDENPEQKLVWIEGELLFADVTVEKSAGVVTLRTKFPNPYKALLPGMYVRAIFDQGVIPNAILVPQRTVMYDFDGSAYVYLLVPDADSPADSAIFTVVKRTVTIRDNYGTNWHISAGLAPGEMLLLDGHLKARPGSKVTGQAVAIASDAVETPTASNPSREVAR